MNIFKFINMQRPILRSLFHLVRCFLLNSLSSLYDCWCFQATQGKGLISQHLWFHDRNLWRRTLSNGPFTLEFHTHLTAVQNKNLCPTPQHLPELGHSYHTCQPHIEWPRGKLSSQDHFCYALRKCFHRVKYLTTPKENSSHKTC